jgi:hypothetical protein
VGLKAITFWGSPINSGHKPFGQKAIAFWVVGLLPVIRLNGKAIAFFFKNLTVRFLESDAIVFRESAFEFIDFLFEFASLFFQVIQKRSPFHSSTKNFQPL